MFGRPRILSTPAVADKLTDAADLIAAASRILDDACCGASSEVAARISRIPHLRHIDGQLAALLRACATELNAEHDEQVAAMEAEFEATDAGHSVRAEIGMGSAA